MKFIDLGI